MQGALTVSCDRDRKIAVLPEGIDRNTSVRNEKRIMLFQLVQRPHHSALPGAGAGTIGHAVDAKGRGNGIGMDRAD